jgi:hypothetical protein
MTESQANARQKDFSRGFNGGFLTIGRANGGFGNDTMPIFLKRRLFQREEGHF